MELRKKVAEAEHNLKEARRETAKQSGELMGKDSQVQQYADKIAKLEEELGENRSKVLELQNQVKVSGGGKDAVVTELEKRLEQKESLINGLRAVRAELLDARDVYQQGESSPGNNTAETGGKVVVGPGGDEVEAGTPRGRALRRQVVFFQTQAQSMEGYLTQTVSV